ncbi:peptide deformylase [Dethiosulfovibrio sp. F2B]|uniref:peptide deformylase n=1 Tax=Dethiosulfovibrio faecalis TaxID=2720018 RepID=UPI001F4070DF|nr:peptide deformylase [Dethiosulfovibrio faecalis]MCF4150409.1 peptide deformylase [Dethiosulfovibrio faecalis]
MSDRTIRIYPDPVLREPTREIERFDDDFRSFLKEMESLMYEYDGVGLAAPQVGESLKVAVIAYEGKLYVLVNPRIVDYDGRQMDQEGCLSFPGIFEDVARPASVVVEAQDENGEPYSVEAEGFLARAMCHEIDHLNGKLMIDHLSPMKREMVKKKLKKRKKEDL